VAAGEVAWAGFPTDADGFFTGMARRMVGEGAGAASNSGGADAPGALDCWADAIWAAAARRMSGRRRICFMASRGCCRIG
jgi:hypothetical protein